jgi:hypothetical protein
MIACSCNPAHLGGTPRWMVAEMKGAKLKKENCLIK